MVSSSPLIDNNHCKWKIFFRILVLSLITLAFANFVSNFLYMNVFSATFKFTSDDGGWGGGGRKEEEVDSWLAQKADCTNGSDAYVSSCLDPSGPQPVIFMSHGRSGSSSTWAILGNLTGYETKNEEITGSDAERARKFFHDKKNSSIWMMQYLCHTQRKYPKAQLVGFQWKPFLDTIQTIPAKSALERTSMTNPKIKVILNRRNLLDIIISQEKHFQSPEGQKKGKSGNGWDAIGLGVGFGAHCKAGKEKCLEKHLSIRPMINVTTLVGRLKAMEEQEDKVDELLMAWGVPHILVSYDRLYNDGDDDVDEWKRILDFLNVKVVPSSSHHNNGQEEEIMVTSAAGEPPKEDIAAIILNQDRVHQAMKMVPTHKAHHRDSLANYEEVAAVLRGTKYESLLH